MNIEEEEKGIREINNKNKDVLFILCIIYDIDIYAN